MTGLRETFGQIQGYLAELRYIDTAMKYMEEEQAGWFQGTFGGLVTPGNEYLEVEYGTTYPFTKRYEVPSDWFDLPFIGETKSDRLNERLTELAGNATEWAETRCSELWERIEPLLYVNSGSYNSCLNRVEDMHTAIGDELDDNFGDLKFSLSHWRGDAADNFAKNFYYPYAETRRSQKTMIAALVGGISGAKAIAESTAHSIENLLDATKKLVDEQLQLAQATAALEREQRQQQALIIAGGMATILGGLFSGGGLWAAGLAGVAGTTQIASASIPTEGADHEFFIEGSTAAEIVEALGASVTVVKNTDKEQHGVLENEIDDALSRMNTLRGGADGDDGRLIPEEPNLVNGVTADDFRVA